MITVLLIALLASLVLTDMIRRYALTKHWLDVPNARSSHIQPTPKGGGLAIASVFIAGMTIFYSVKIVSSTTWLAFSGATLLTAWVGYIDDKQSVSVLARLAAHFLAAGWGIYWLDGVTLLTHLTGDLAPGIILLLTLLYLTWVLNLFNFMDGIDGIAGVEAICVSLGACLLLLFTQENCSEIWPLLLLAFSVAGFLYWNFPPAKIFMGDAGSGFLGLVLGLFSIQAATLGLQLFYSWLILLAVFIVDASWTLVRRCWSGEKFYQAHRTHAYQYAARYWASHKPVTITVALINLVWLFPMSLIVALNLIDGRLGVVLAYTPLLMLAIRFKAGCAEHS